VVGSRRRLQPTLVGAQVALALVLLAGAGVLLRTVAELQAVGPGFDAEHVLSFRMTATWNESGRADLLGARHQRTLERLAALPGVTAASHINSLPATPAGAYPPAPVAIAGQPDDPTRLVFTRQVSPNYFRVTRMPIVEGEDCRPDIPNRPARDVVVNQAFAARHFPGSSAIGQHITVGSGRPVPIIGVVGDARERSLSQPPEPTAYSCGMTFYPDPFIVVRMDPARPVSVDTIRAAMREIEPTRAVYAPRLLSDVVAETTSQPRLNSTMLGAFAGIAVLLVAVGLYAMLSQFVTERTREIGVRLALGARPIRILADVLGRTTAVVTIGLGAGLGASLLLARFVSTLVYGISPRDPVTLVVVTAVLIVVAVAAALPPAWRAAGMDPLAALRSE
jgi:putative ABC transport system permease protein